MIIKLSDVLIKYEKDERDALNMVAYPNHLRYTLQPCKLREEYWMLKKFHSHVNLKEAQKCGCPGEGDNFRKEQFEIARKKLNYARAKILQLKVLLYLIQINIITFIFFRTNTETSRWKLL